MLGNKRIISYCGGFHCSCNIAILQRYLATLIALPDFFLKKSQGAILYLLLVGKIPVCQFSLN